MELINKKLLLAVPMVAFGLASFGAGEGASQKWVKQYVEQYVSNAIAKSATTLASEAKSTVSNGVNTISIGEGYDRVWIEWEDATVYALMVTNATAAVAEYGITNGFVFVWDGDNSFVNGNGELVKITSDTNKTCYTWHEIDSVRTNALDVFDGKFSVGGVMIQPSFALDITNALTTVSTRQNVWNVFFQLLFPSAYADRRSDFDYWLTGSFVSGDEIFAKAKVYRYNPDGYGGHTVKWRSVSLTSGSLLNLADHPDGSEATAEMKTALSALEQAFLARRMSIQIAENLSKQDWTEKEAQVNDTAAGVSYSGNISKSGKSYVLNVPNSLVPKTDGKTITTKGSGNDKYLCLANLPASTSVVRIPTLTTGGALTWNALTGLVDSKSIDPAPTDRDHLEIKGWSWQKACDATMEGMLTDAKRTDSKSHHVLCRYKEGNKWVMHYVPFGELSIADETSITGEEEGDKQEGRLSIKGANKEENEGKALVSTGSGIEWKGFGVKFVGTDNSSNYTEKDGEPNQTITFASATDSNVKVTVNGTKDSATITIGVYYK